MNLTFFYESEAYRNFEKAVLDFAICMKVYCLLHPIYLYELLEAPKYDEV